MDEKKHRSTWEIFSETISRLSSRLDQIEQILSELQMRKVIYDESRIVEAQGLLGGKTYLTSAEGDVQKLIRVPACDVCGINLRRGFVAICHHCGRKMCYLCTLTFEGQAHCINCMKEHHVNLSKKGWKILKCVSEGVVTPSVISRLTKILREENRERGCCTGNV